MTTRVIAVTVLAACSSAPPPPMTNAVAREPAKPPAIAVQLAYRGTFMIGPPFSQVPPFTLLDDGTWIGADEDEKSVKTVRLSHAELERIRAHVLELGFARLESHTDSCNKMSNGTSVCVSDASYTILRVAMPTGQLREITTYAGFSNEPAVQEKIVDYLSHYPHPKAVPYRPTRAALHVSATTRPLPPACPAIAPEVLHVDPAQPRWGVMIDGKDLAAVLAIAPVNRGTFVACAGKTAYVLTLVPEVPGADLSEELRVYERK